ncbi:unnamed protein product [Meganyctiphanes norvegica]|uniref:Uncharacterized protein n=1 Tax=Meganyctiphanes norvegica TaxID=48144 RepID=A0AAV2RQ86_MEGNR
MVAPYSFNTIGRSFVRVPGTGSGSSNGSSSAVCCDLSRGSNLASIVTVPDMLPGSGNNNSGSTASKVCNLNMLSDCGKKNSERSASAKCNLDTLPGSATNNNDHSTSAVCNLDTLPGSGTNNSDSSASAVSNLDILPGSVTNSSDRSASAVCDLDMLPGSDTNNSDCSASAVCSMNTLPTMKPAQSALNLKRACPEDVQETQYHNEDDDKHKTNQHKRLKTEESQPINIPNQLYISPTRNLLFQRNNASNNETVELQQENSALKAENQILHKQLQLFKELVLNPELLSDVLQRVQMKME